MMTDEVAPNLGIREDEHFSNDGGHDQEQRRVQWKLLARSGPFDANPADCQIWNGNTRDVPGLAASDLSELIASIVSVGQQVPVIARILPSDASRLEIIAGASRFTAINLINEQRRPEDRMLIKVDLRKLDDETAFKIVDAENRGRADFSPLERARLFERAINTVYHTEAALADAFGVNKSTVNRLMAITKLPREVMNLILDPHQISARQASEFMSDWTSPVRETLEETIADLDAKGPAHAAAIFKALKVAVAPTDIAVESLVVHGEARLGVARSGKHGSVRIDLDATAGEIPLKALVIAVGNALKQLSAERR